MEKKNKTLAICTQGAREMEYLTRFFTRYFDGLLDIVEIAADELEHLSLQPEVIMTTHVTKELVQRIFPGSKVLFTERCLTGHNLEEIIQLPAGTKALVVNYPEKSAHETLSSLVGLGINHINPVAYWPDSPVDATACEVVIYPGIIDYCPKGNYRYINIGNRSVAISTIIEIIKIFDLPPACAENYYYDNIQKITDGCYKLESALRETNQMKNSLEKVCNLNRNIVFVIDEKDKITIFNPAAEKYFGRKRTAVIGGNYQEELGEQAALTEAIASGQKLNDSLISVNGYELVVTSNEFHINDCDNRLINIIPVAELQKSESKARIKLHAKDFAAKYHFEDIVGTGLCIQKGIKIAKTYANSDATVLLMGESGTGKELFAQSIHNASQRRPYPFVGINFAALPESLAESELFGYEEGAFTGALKGGKAGLFEIAHQGTIFLDEIGDASLSMQTKLLRILEEREVVRVGGRKVVPIDVRIICATNKNLKEMVKDHTFREDLYYRIKVLTLSIPSLRERREDISDIMGRLFRSGTMGDLIDDEVLHRLYQYDWPGNVRELKATVEYINMLGTLSEREGYTRNSIKEMLREFLDINLDGGVYTFTETAEGRREQESAEDIALSEDLQLLLEEAAQMQKHNIIVGRGSMAKRSKVQEAGLTETMVKTRLKKLEQLRLIKIGVTKQGISLTALGMARTRSNC